MVRKQRTCMKSRAAGRAAVNGHGAKRPPHGLDALIGQHCRALADWQAGPASWPLRGGRQPCSWLCWQPGHSGTAGATTKSRGGPAMCTLCPHSSAHRPALHPLPPSLRKAAMKLATVLAVLALAAIVAPAAAEINKGISLPIISIGKGGSSGAAAAAAPAPTPEVECVDVCKDVCTPVTTKACKKVPVTTKVCTTIKKTVAEKVCQQKCTTVAVAAPAPATTTSTTAASGGKGSFLASLLAAKGKGRKLMGPIVFGKGGSSSAAASTTTTAAVQTKQECADVCTEVPKTIEVPDCKDVTTEEEKCEDVTTESCTKKCEKSCKTVEAEAEPAASTKSSSGKGISISISKGKGH